MNEFHYLVLYGITLTLCNMSVFLLSQFILL